MSLKLQASVPFTAFLLTGPAGSGKSTLAELIKEHLLDDPRKLVCVDTSACLATSRARETKTGQALKKLIPEQKKGLILPGELVVTSIFENFQWMYDKYQTNKFMLSGSPRSIEESQAWIDARKQQKVSFKAFLVKCDREQVEAGVDARRRKKGPARDDDGPEEVETRWREYLHKTVPSIDYLPQNLVGRTERSKSILERVRDIVMHMELPDAVRKKYLHRLNTRDHPIRKAIWHIENPEDSQLTTSQKTHEQCELALA